MSIELRLMLVVLRSHFLLIHHAIHFLFSLVCRLAACSEEDINKYYAHYLIVHSKHSIFVTPQKQYDLRLARDWHQ